MLFQAMKELSPFLRYHLLLIPHQKNHRTKNLFLLFLIICHLGSHVVNLNAEDASKRNVNSPYLVRKLITKNELRIQTQIVWKAPGCEPRPVRVSFCVNTSCIKLATKDYAKKVNDIRFPPTRKT